MKRKTTIAQKARIGVELTFLALFIFFVFEGKAQLWLGVFGAGVILAPIFSRFYCAWICPMNTLFRPIAWLYQKFGLKRANIPHFMNHPVIRAISVVLLIVSMLLAKRLGSTIPPLAVMTGLALLVVLVFEEALWHNSLCPFGTILSLSARPAMKNYAVETKSCIACGKCQEVCPVHVIDTLEGGKRVIRKADCLVCGNCAKACPPAAIRYRREREPLSAAVPSSTMYPRNPKEAVMGMFCNQCQETAKNSGCTVSGVCGKKEETAKLQDLLVFSCQGLSFAAIEARKIGIDTGAESRHIVNSLFMTITNANFDDTAILRTIKDTLKFRDALSAKAAVVEKHDSVAWRPTDDEEFFAKAAEVGILSYDPDDDVRSLKQYVLYGLKGIAAYTEHAFNLGSEDPAVFDFLERSLVMITKFMTADAMLDWLMKTGECGVKAMALLDTANTTNFGNPEITKVKIGAGDKPGILISGHDLKDLEQLLIQSAGKGIDIYTHSEMLPAHAYPGLKKYKHLIGNYGGAWHRQLEDFETFNGPILFTTNCLVPPKKTASYNDRTFTTGTAGMGGWKHLSKRLPNGEKDFSEIIELAKKCPPPKEIEQGEIVIGFAHDQTLALADKILAAINAGAIKKLVVMSGCDARQKAREYYTEFARKLPNDTVILTSGCAKYRYNKLDLGDIGGIPRVLDAGQCNDSYSWAVVALKLKEVLGLDDINKLPIVFNIGWYEQKAIIVHLALLYLGIRNTHIGPTLPGFMTPNVLKIVQEKFGVRTITTADDDMKLFGIA